METCNKPCLVYSRVVGYHNPIQMWNKGKRAEFEERVPYVRLKRQPKLSTVRALQVYQGAVI